MKLKDGFVLTDVGETKIAVPIGERAKEFNGIVRLNDTGSFIWNCLADGLEAEEIANRLVEEYDGVDYDTALSYTEELISKLKKDGMIED